jgi:hypothetical protein
MTSAQANPERSKATGVTFSWLIAEALRSMGHEVDHRTPLMGDTCEDYDHVICGVQAPHAVGSNRIYGALNVIGRAEAQEKLSLFVDDLEMNKILGGMRVMRNDPNKFTKPFYWYRLEYEQAKDEPYRAYLYDVLMRLLDYQWPPTLLPLFPWSEMKAWERRVPNAAGQLHGVNPSGFVPEYDDDPLHGLDREKVWVTETPGTKWYGTLRPTFPVHAYGSVKKGYTKRPSDEAMFEQLCTSWGVLHDARHDGWFDAMLIHAARAESLVVAPWNRVEALGSSYSVLPDTAAEWDAETRDKTATLQAEAIWPTIEASREQMTETLGRLIGK